MARTLFLVVLFISSAAFSQKFLGQQNDILNCISDIGAIKTEIHTFLAGNVTFESLMNEIRTVTPILQNALYECGINVKLPSLFSNITEQIVISFDFMACLSDLNTLVTLITDLTTDAESGNIVKVVEDLAHIKTNVVALMSDCTVNNSPNISKDIVFFNDLSLAQNMTSFN